MKEIVGAKIGTIITNSLKSIREAVDRGSPVQFLDRKTMQFMSDMDLGRNWDAMANGPTLFLLDNDGNPHAPNN